MTKVSHARLSGTLKGKVKFSWRLLSNVRFPYATFTDEKEPIYKIDKQRINRLGKIKRL